MEQPASAIWAVMFVVGCGGPAAQPAAPIAQHVAKVPTVPWAPLFEAGRSWTLPAEALRVRNDGELHVERTAGTMTCAVGEVSAVRGGKRARLDCKLVVDNDDLVDRSTSGGVVSSPAQDYVATADGLWQLLGAEIRDDTLDPRYALLRAEPRAGTTYEDGHNAYKTLRHHGAWCYEFLYDLDGSPGGWRLCLRDGQIVGGAGLAWGPDTRLVYFGDVPHDPIR